MQTAMTDTYDGELPEIVKCITPDCGNGGIYPGKEFKNVRLVWLEGGEDEPSMPYLQADCPNSACKAGQVYVEMKVDIDLTLEGWEDCLDCEGWDFVMLDLELFLSQDRQEWLIYESVREDVRSWKK